MFLLPWVMTLITDGPRMLIDYKWHRLDEERNELARFITPGTDAPLSMRFLPGGSVVVDLHKSPEFEKLNKDWNWWNETDTE